MPPFKRIGGRMGHRTTKLRSGEGLANTKFSGGRCELFERGDGSLGALTFRRRLPNLRGFGEPRDDSWQLGILRCEPNRGSIECDRVVDVTALLGDVRQAAQC